MTNRSAFASMVDRIFGSGSATFDTSVAQSNDVIGALAHPTEFTAFKDNFEARLHRLKSAVEVDASLRAEILAAVNRLVDAGWDGAYAELSALDYFLAYPATGPGQVLLDRTVPAQETLASEMGMQNANHDLSFPFLGVSLDTKLLSDKTGEILAGIFREYRSTKGLKDLLIIPSYDLHSDFEQYKRNRKALLDELVNEVDTIVQPKTLASTVLPGLSYSFAWSQGVYFGEGSYSPHEHAKHHHSLLFGHAKKFSRLEPTIIVFVIFPWSGERTFPFDDTKRIFLRQFGRHFFNDYIESDTPASAFNKKFKSGILAGDVTRHLSGVMFLEDNAITSSNPGLLNVDASYIWNPNALQQLSGDAFDIALQDRGAYDLSAFD
ncbi:hypothetical protein [Stenotrophomonas sp.]|uniref:hypothetical protein n=1 Tax=Stenotrophomonas sp. TaxID=69392 RepID=UPI0028ABD805|nr:hypothetical protein [Stenotrophomonas sp.]